MANGGASLEHVVQYAWHYMQLNVMRAGFIQRLYMHIIGTKAAMQILKINIRKSCLGIRSFAGRLAARARRQFIDPWRRGTPTIGVAGVYDRCGRADQSLQTTAVSTPVIRPRPSGTVLAAVGTLVSVRRGHHGTLQACHSSFSDTWGPIDAVCMQHRLPGPATDF